MAQRDWRGSMILFEALQAKAKRVLEEWISIVRRRACCAPAVILNKKRGLVTLWVWKGAEESVRKILSKSLQQVVRYRDGVHAYRLRQE